MLGIRSTSAVSTQEQLSVSLKHLADIFCHFHNGICYFTVRCHLFENIFMLIFIMV